MLSDREYVRQSLELNLFFMRIMKEHSLFIEAAFTPKNKDLAEQAEEFKRIFTGLLRRAIELSEGVISSEVLNSGEIVTDLTLTAEKETEFYTGIAINSKLTRGELELESGNMKVSQILVQRVYMLNQQAMNATTALADYKTCLLRDVLSCKLFTANYPLLLDHILREAKFYLKNLVRLQRRESEDTLQDAVAQEIFWNRIMAEHAKFIRGLLDPTEVKLFNTANDFGNRFDQLNAETEKLSQQIVGFNTVTAETLKATKEIRDFKRQGTQGLEDCTIRSIILPLLGDHVLREANHYLRLLKDYSAIKFV